MPRFIEAESRAQATLFPEHIEDYIDKSNPVRAIEAFVDMLDLEGIGFQGMMPKVTGRPAYHPSTMQAYLNRIQSTRRLELETGRNRECLIVELIEHCYLCCRGFEVGTAPNVSESENRSLLQSLVS